MGTIDPSVHEQPSTPAREQAIARFTAADFPDTVRLTFRTLEDGSSLVTFTHRDPTDAKQNGIFPPPVNEISFAIAYDLIEDAAVMETIYDTAIASVREHLAAL